jgi:hypothetical protein
MDRHPNILNAASNLLSVCFFLITGLRFTDRSGSWADEIAWGAAMLFLISCALSYLAIRHASTDGAHVIWADRAFMAGLALLVVAVAIAAIAT